MVAQHKKHPEVDQIKNRSSSPVHNVSKPQEKKTKYSDLKSEKFTQNLYKEFIIEWLIKYEKTLKKALDNSSSEGTKVIDSHAIRSSITVQSDMIDEYSENDLFFRDDLWN